MANECDLIAFDVAFQAHGRAHQIPAVAVILDEIQILTNGQLHQHRRARLCANDLFPIFRVIIGRGRINGGVCLDQFIIFLNICHPGPYGIWRIGGCVEHGIIDRARLLGAFPQRRAGDGAVQIHVPPYKRVFYRFGWHRDADDVFRHQIAPFPVIVDGVGHGDFARAAGYGFHAALGREKHRQAVIVEFFRACGENRDWFWPVPFHLGLRVGVGGVWGVGHGQGGSRYRQGHAMVAFAKGGIAV